MDSLLRSKRSLRLPPSSKSNSANTLVQVPADVIVALRTASFSASTEDIDEMLRETESVLGRPISIDVKLLIRERYHAADGSLPSVLLAWLKETLGESDESSSLSIDDLSSIFAGADKIAQQMLSGDVELSLVSTPREKSESTVDNVSSLASSSLNPSSAARRQWAAAFEETARAVSQKRLGTSQLLSSDESFRFDPSLVAEDLDQIFADASTMHFLPLVAPQRRSMTSSQPVRIALDDETASRTQPAAQEQNESIAGTNNLIDELIRDFKTK